MVYSGKRRPRNSKLEKVYERVDTLASKEHTETEARIAKRFVEENWAKFPSDYENTSRNQRSLVERWKMNFSTISLVYVNGKQIWSI